MAFNLENMTVSYKSLLKLVPTQRNQLAQSGTINDLISALTPGQLVNLFPRYYRDQLPDVGQVNNYSQRLDSALSGGSKLTSSSAGGITTYGNIPAGGNRKLLTPEEKAIQELFQKANVGNIELTGSSREKAAALTERIVEDLSISENKAAAIVGNFMHESGNFQYMQEIDPVSGRGGYGWAQWTGARRKNFEEFVADRGLDINSDDANYQFFLHEIQNDPYERKRFEEWKNTDYGNLSAETVAFEDAYERAGIKHHGSRIERAEEALQMYEQRIADIEKNADSIKELPSAQFDPNMLSVLDERLQKWYQNANDIQKRNFETALGKLGAEQFNEVMKRQPINSPTLSAVSDIGNNGIYELTDKLGNLTPNLRQFDPKVDDPGKSAPGEFNYSLSSEGIQRFNLADETGRVTRASVEKNLTVIETESGVKVQVHKDIADRTRNFLNALEAKGYPVRSADTAGYSFRGKNGGAGSGLSTHATGTTFDINSGTNWGTMQGGNGTIDMPPDIEKLANYYGFSWGARFGDPMHFETMSPDLHAQKLKELEDQGYIRRRDDKIRAEAEAKAQASPVSATAASVEPNTLPTPPALASGGNVQVPPGEDIVGINTKTGNPEFFANSRENIRVEPGTLESKQQMPIVTQEEKENLETPMQSVNTNKQPIYRDSPDPDLFNASSGNYYIPPSQLRATNRAKLRGDDSSYLINDHFI